MVVPGASFICQEVNLSEIESENNARKILKSCMTGDCTFSPFCRSCDSKIDCGTLTPHTPVVVAGTNNVSNESRWSVGEQLMLSVDRRTDVASCVSSSHCLRRLTADL